VRRSGREKKPPERYGDYRVHYVKCVSELDLREDMQKQRYLRRKEDVV